MPNSCNFHFDVQSFHFDKLVMDAKDYLVYFFLSSGSTNLQKNLRQSGSIQIQTGKDKLCMDWLSLYTQTCKCGTSGYILTRNCCDVSGSDCLDFSVIMTQRNEWKEMTHNSI